MNKKSTPFRAISIILFLVYLHSLILTGVALGDDPDCGFDPENPSLDNARNMFLQMNYVCAEQELNALLSKTDMATEERADMHVLLAEVYYAKVRNSNEKRDKVIEQFVAAFDAYRQWKGELNIKSPEFMAMMKDAQIMVDDKAADVAESEPPVEKPPTDSQPPEEITTLSEVPVTRSATSDDESKPFYKQWWAYALGIGVVVGAVALLAGGGSDDPGGGGEPVDTLPYFPDPPTKGR